MGGGSIVWYTAYIHIAGVTTTQVWSKLVKRGLSVTRRITLVMKVLYLAVSIWCQKWEERLTEIQQQTFPLTQPSAEEESST